MSNKFCEAKLNLFLFKMAVFWVVAPCRLVKFANVSGVCTAYGIYAVPQPRRQQPSSFSAVTIITAHSVYAFSTRGFLPPCSAKHPAHSVHKD
jgi:hypothetical protein